MQSKELSRNCVRCFLERESRCCNCVKGTLGAAKDPCHKILAPWHNYKKSLKAPNLLTQTQICVAALPASTEFWLSAVAVRRSMEPPLYPMVSIIPSTGLRAILVFSLSISWILEFFVSSVKRRAVAVRMLAGVLFHFFRKMSCELVSVKDKPRQPTSLFAYSFCSLGLTFRHTDFMSFKL